MLKFDLFRYLDSTSLDSSRSKIRDSRILAFSTRDELLTFPSTKIEVDRNENESFIDKNDQIERIEKNSEIYGNFSRLEKTSDENIRKDFLFSIDGQTDQSFQLKEQNSNEKDQSFSL